MYLFYSHRLFHLKWFDAIREYCTYFIPFFIWWWSNLVTSQSQELFMRRKKKQIYYCLVKGNWLVRFYCYKNKVEYFIKLVWHKQVPLKVSIVRGVCWKTGYQLKSISKGAALFRSQTLAAFRGAVMMSRHPICSFIVMFLVRFGSISDLGLVCLV